MTDAAFVIRDLARGEGQTAPSSPVTAEGTTGGLKEAKDTEAPRADPRQSAAPSVSASPGPCDLIGWARGEGQPNLEPQRPSQPRPLQGEAPSPLVRFLLRLLEDKKGDPELNTHKFKAALARLEREEKEGTWLRQPRPAQEDVFEKIVVSLRDLSSTTEWESDVAAILRDRFGPVVEALEMIANDRIEDRYDEDAPHSWKEIWEGGYSALRDVARAALSRLRADGGWE